MRKVLPVLKFTLRLRRRASLCVGILAIVFQVLMPFANAFAASLPGLSSTEVICDASGRLISIDGNQSSPLAHSTACEFCLACPFSMTGNLNEPVSLTDRVSFADIIVIWTGLPVITAHLRSDYAARPVRAPPSFV